MASGGSCLRDSRVRTFAASTRSCLSTESVREPAGRAETDRSRMRCGSLREGQGTLSTPLIESGPFGPGEERINRAL